MVKLKAALDRGPWARLRRREYDQEERSGPSSVTERAGAKAITPPTSSKAKRPTILERKDGAQKRTRTSTACTTGT